MPDQQEPFDLDAIKNRADTWNYLSESAPLQDIDALIAEVERLAAINADFQKQVDHSAFFVWVEKHPMRYEATNSAGATVYVIEYHNGDQRWYFRFPQFGSPVLGKQSGYTNLFGAMDAVEYHHRTKTSTQK